MTNPADENSWFEEWFDTRFYHLLYQHRDDREAKLFIDALFEELKPKAEWHVLDLACGRGRHARYVHSKGVEVTGLDLAESNIEYASQFLANRLHFQVADMRKPFGSHRFDLVLNLFTSFGYFENWDDNLEALRQIKASLKPGGLLVIDFLNLHLVRNELIPNEEVRVEGYHFNISRSIGKGKILKTIDLSEPDGTEHHYKEEVWALSLQEFEVLLRESELELLSVYGSYNLAKFEAQNSERLILLARA